MSDAPHTAPPSTLLAPFGVYSEVGQLRSVLVCAPGLAHNRLTPSNCDDLLFDDVMWVDNARRDHAEFVAMMRGRGIEVLELHDLLAETLALPDARSWLLDRKITPDEVGLGLVEDVRSFLDSLDPAALARYVIGGLSTADLPRDFGPPAVQLVREESGMRDYLMPPLPNTLFTRDTTSWVYQGVTLNPLFWEARHAETLIMKAVYTFHPDLRRAGHHVVGRPGAQPRSRVARGRRRHAGRRRRGRRRHVGKVIAPGHLATRRRIVRRGTPPIAWWSPRCRACGPRCTWTPCSRWLTATSAPSSLASSTKSRLSRSDPLTPP